VRYEVSKTETKEQRMVIQITRADEAFINDTLDVEELKKLIQDKLSENRVKSVKKFIDKALKDKRKSDTLSRHNQFAKSRRNKLVKRRTDSEKLMAAKLKKAGIDFIEQHPFHTKHTFYIADFFIPTMKLILELDGEYHFLDEQEKKDSRRNT